MINDTTTKKTTALNYEYFSENTEFHVDLHILKQQEKNTFYKIEIFIINSYCYWNYKLYEWTLNITNKLFKWLTLEWGKMLLDK